ncbi:MAG: HDOD domain-containing protein [Terracidiphilus sp.]
MATAVGPAYSSRDAGHDAAGGVHLVARQPILDLHGRVHAYALRFRGGAGPDGRTMLETAAMLGLERPSELKKLTGRLTAFVHCAEETLGERLAQQLPATLTVVEIRARGEVAPGLIDACRQLKEMGFRLALDDFRGQPQFEPLVELADYIKVDFGGTRPEQRRELFEKLRGRTIAMLARNVETQAEYRQARQEGFTLFEGYYFCEPVMMRNRRPPPNQLLRIEILKALQRHPMDLPKVSELVKRDGPLAYQLLRLVNSPLWAVRQPVESIQAALMAVGEDAFRRIATLAIASDFNGDQPAELLCMAMVRGRFCEVAGLERDLDPFGQYLLGLLSLLPAMQGQPMSDVIPALPLSAEIREALMGTGNRERVLLGWLENCERGNWAGCDAAAEAEVLNQEELGKVYVEAVAWAEAALHSAG